MHFAKSYSLTAFDAMHAAFCSAAGDEILSSDAVVETVGQRIELESAKK